MQNLSTAPPPPRPSTGRPPSWRYPCKVRRFSSRVRDAPSISIRHRQGIKLGWQLKYTVCGFNVNPTPPLFPNPCPQTLYMPSTEPVPSCPAYLLPTEEWEREVLSTFVDLRQVEKGRKSSSRRCTPFETNKGLLGSGDFWREG